MPGETVPVLPSVMGSPVRASRTVGVTSQLPVQPSAQGPLPVTAASQAWLMAASGLLRRGFLHITADSVPLGGMGGEPTSWLFWMCRKRSLARPSSDGICPVSWLSCT